MIAENDMSGGAPEARTPEGVLTPSTVVFTVNVRVAPSGGVQVTLWADDKALEASPGAVVVAAKLSKTVRDMVRDAQDAARKTKEGGR